MEHVEVVKVGRSRIATLRLRYLLRLRWEAIREATCGVRRHLVGVVCRELDALVMASVINDLHGCNWVLALNVLTQVVQLKKLATRVAPEL